MTELFVYDVSEVNRGSYIPFEKDPVILGFRESLRQLNPPTPFLVRGILEDFEENSSNNRQGKNTFRGKSVGVLLKKVLRNGSDNDDDKIFFWPSNDESKHIRNRGLKGCDFIYAFRYNEIENAQPYRTSNDWGDIPYGCVNDFSMVFDAKLYLPLLNSHYQFYQQDIEKRRKALLGIIISDTNPNRPQLQPMRYNLTPENLDDVVERLTEAGYFTAV